jgi:hypothetical protein
MVRVGMVRVGIGRPVIAGVRRLIVRVRVGVRIVSGRVGTGRVRRSIVRVGMVRVGIGRPVIAGVRRLIVHVRVGVRTVRARVAQTVEASIAEGRHPLATVIVTQSGRGWNVLETR